MLGSAWISRKEVCTDRSAYIVGIAISIDGDVGASEDGRGGRGVYYALLAILEYTCVYIYMYVLVLPLLVPVNPNLLRLWRKDSVCSRPSFS